MTETRLDNLNMRWYPEVSVLRVSETDVFDPAFEQTAREFHVTDWLSVGGRSVPVISVNGHSKEDVLQAFTQHLI